MKEWDILQLKDHFLRYIVVNCRSNMSYPRTTEERLVKLYGFSLTDLTKIYNECNKNKNKYKKKLEELDTALAASVFAQITSDKFIVH